MMISLIIKFQIKLQGLRYELLQKLFHKEMKNQSKYQDNITDRQRIIDEAGII